MKISERSDFSILCKIETKNRNLGNLGNVCSTSNSETKCDSIFKTNKNRTETKTKSFPYDLREKKNISIISKILISPYTQLLF